VDAYLASCLKEYSRGYFQRLIDMGHVLVNSQKTASSCRLKEGDEIEIIIVNKENKIKPENIPLEIVYEDKDIIVVNKRPGLVVHPACGHPEGTLVNALAGHFKGKFVPYLVHRLDKDTSGVMVVAKNEKVKASLVKQFQNRTISKEYIAAVGGNVSENEGRIEAPLGRSHQDRRKIVVGPLAKKMAITEFKVLSRHSGYTVVAAHPITGRTHQIRSHFAFIGHPVLGDETYGGPLKIGEKSFERQFLHAHKLSFTHPSKAKKVEFSAKLPKDMAWLSKKH